MNRVASVFAAMALAASVLGCAAESTPTVHGDPPASHNHPTEGPHHGHLIELGNEEYHAELVHDDATGKVTIFVLDSTAKNEVQISVSELSLNIVIAGAPRQFKLKAVGDLGNSSQFEIVDMQLVEFLEGDESLDARLSLAINGKAYSGSLEHQMHGDTIMIMTTNID